MLAHTSRAVCVVLCCVCLGQWGSVCLAACHLLGQWAHWSPGSCRCRLLSVWQVINRAQDWTPTLLAAVPTVLQSWTHTTLSTEPAECVLCVCTNVYYFPDSLTHNCFTPWQNRGVTHQQESMHNCPLYPSYVFLFSFPLFAFFYSWSLSSIVSYPHTFISPIFSVFCFLSLYFIIYFVFHNCKKVNKKS